MYYVNIVSVSSWWVLALAQILASNVSGEVELWWDVLVALVPVPDILGVVNMSLKFL